MSILGDNMANIKVIGVGGGGVNAVNRMISSGVTGVEFVVMNTDHHVLELSPCRARLQLGPNTLRGLGAGGDPCLGRAAADESRPEIRRILEGADMVFIAAGMGGGTGTGAASVIAEMSREAETLTVSVVTKPFFFEGPQRSSVADSGISELREQVDTLIVIPNDRLLSVVDKRAPLTDAFTVADDVLRQGVQGISDIITIPGLINIDFNDVKSIMADKGTALMGIGLANGEQRAAHAAEQACASPLLETTIDGAKAVLVNITGGPDLMLSEVSEAAEIVYKACDVEKVNVILGAVIDPEMQEGVKITVVATGFDSRERRVLVEAKAGAMSEFGGISQLEGPVLIDSESELEIPAFLRRQHR